MFTDIVTKPSLYRGTILMLASIRISFGKSGEMRLKKLDLKIVDGLLVTTVELALATESIT